jgi:CheY-like chemotaxis protein
MSVILPALAGKVIAPSKVKASLVAPFTSAERFCGRALLVDDEEDVRRVTRRMLERLGIEVVEAAEGKQGLGIFQKEGDSFVGVLLDLTMPEMDGLETYQRLLSMRPGLQALLVSGYGMEEMKDRLREYPGMALVQKPFGQKELSKALMGIGWPLAALPSDSEEFRRAEEVYLSMLGILMDESRDAGSFFEGLGTLWAQLPGIRFAWAGGLDETGERILPVTESTRAISGEVRFGFMEADSPWNQGPAGSALRSGQPIVLNEMDKDPESAPWRESAIRAGFGSAAVFPLKIGGLVVGMWHLYAFERGYFDYHRVAFFEEAAGLLAKGFQKFQKPTV